MSVDPEAWKAWTPAAQQRALDELRRRVNDQWRPFYCPRPKCDGKPHDDWQWNHARHDQHPPADPDWLVWLMLSGRGAGKTRAGSEYTHRMSQVTGRIALIGATAPDVRDTMLEGESGLLTIAPPGMKPHHEPSKRRLTWPNGCIATTFSAEEPDRLRGPEHGYAWVDEPAHFSQIQDTWDNLMFGLRIGRRPRVVCTSTPKPRPWVKAVSKDPTTRVTRSSTYDNVDNLAPVFAERIIAKYSGTRLGRQELFGEILEDVEGALWSWEMIEAHRTSRHPELSRVVTGVDPAGGAKPKNDETGIVTVGYAADHLYVLGDRSGRYSPQGWANAADAEYVEHRADAVIAETNYGGDMVTSTLRSAGSDKRVLKVHSRRGKAIRAEPIVALYEQGRVHHVGVFPDLETELTTWAPYEDHDSPNRLDALVHACTALVGRGGTVSIATPQSLAARREARRLRAVQAG